MSEGLPLFPYQEKCVDVLLAVSMRWKTSSTNGYSVSRMTSIELSHEKFV